MKYRRIDNAQQAGEYANSLAPGSARQVSPKIRNALSRYVPQVAGTMAGTLSENPYIGSGVAGAGTSVASDLVAGREVDAARAAESGARGAASNYLYNELGESLGPAAGLAVAGVNTLADVAMGRDVDLGRRAITTGVGIAGSIFGQTMVPLPFVGGIIGGFLGNEAGKSYDDGGIGDAFDVREQEQLRDDLEDTGMSYKDTKNISAATRGVGPYQGMDELSVDPDLQYGAIDMTGPEVDAALEDAFSEVDNYEDEDE